MDKYSELSREIYGKWYILLHQDGDSKLHIGYKSYDLLYQ